MHIVSVLTKTETAVIHTLLLDNSPFSEFVFTNSTERVTATAITQPITLSLTAGIAGLKSMHEFNNLIVSNDGIRRAYSSPYTLDISYKANGIDTKLKFGNTTAIDAGYKPATQEVRIRRDVLDMNWADWRLWLEVVDGFYRNIELHKQTF